MKYIFSLLLVFLLSTSAFAAQICDLFENGAISDLTNLSIPNCLSEENLFQETEIQGAGNEQGPICGSCKNDLNARVSIPNNDRIRIKQEAYFNQMYNEFEKSMSTLLVDMVSLRTLYSTGSGYTQASNKCSSRSFEAKIARCESGQKSLFRNKDFSKRIANEISNILNPTSTTIQGILERSQANNTCPISDQSVIGLKPHLLESKINPDQVKALASISVENQAALFEALNNYSPEIFDLIKHHPVLRSLAENPTEFKSFFSTLTNITDPSQLRKQLKTNLYTQAHGNKIDADTAQKCEQAMNTLVSKVCSDDFKNGNISLGPISGFDRFRNEEPFPETNAITNETLLTKNIALLEFCEAPSRSGLSLGRDAESLNSWMRLNDKAKSFKSFASDKYIEEFGTPKQKICRFRPARNCTENSMECELYNLYMESTTPGTPTYNLAKNPDPNVTNVLRAMVGNPSNLSPQTREVLVAEGILPQENGQYVERPEIPERKPEYLANVANGSINPNSGSSAATTRTVNNTNRNNRSQPNNQQVFQAQVTANDTQLAADQDDQEALRRFQDGLDERLRRMESQQGETQVAARTTATTNSRQPTRPTSTTRSANLSQPSSIIAPSAIVPEVAALAPSQSAPTGSSEASLDRDSSRQGLAQRQANDARAQMFGARNNPTAAAGTLEAGRAPASTTESSNEAFASTLSLTVSGDIRANLEKALTDSTYLSSLIAERKPFRFKLNNSLFDVNFRNGTYTVAYRSGRAQDAQFATDLQNFFNSSLSRTDRSARLSDLQKNLSN